MKFKPFDLLIFHLFAPVAQLDRAAAYGAVGWGFDSLQAYKNGVLRLRTAAPVRMDERAEVKSYIKAIAYDARCLM